MMKELNHGKGPIAWMARNAVAANLLMAVLLIGGLIVGSQIKQEVFPEFELDQVQVRVPYPSAGPEEVEQGILLAIEDEVRGLDGIKRVEAQALEGAGIVSIELLRGADPNKMLQDIKNAVDRVSTFPQDAERPEVSRVTTRSEVISLVIYGDLDERTLRRLGERMRDDLLDKENITLVELTGVRPLEIGIEVPQARLRALGLTLDDVARVVRQTALELPGGGVKTESGEVLLRLQERRDWGREFADIPLITQADGTDVRLGDVAAIVDGFEDTDRAAFYNGMPAVMVNVFRVGDQTPLQIAGIVKDYVEEMSEVLPPGVNVATWMDRSEVYRQRIDLLLRNAIIGWLLVLVLLGLFLDLRLAFWVAAGVPVSFLGAFLFMPALDVSINMISLFAFIMALGIVVDDAIIVGENIHKHRQRGERYLKAAVLGAREVCVPVVFSVLTNMVAFAPLLFVPGFAGKIFWVIPAIILPIFLISLVESLFILPAHLGHQREPRKHGVLAFLFRLQQRVGNGIEWFIDKVYRPVLRAALHVRYLTVAVAVAMLVLCVGYVASGRIGFLFMPRVAGDLPTAQVTMPYGVPASETAKAQQRIVAAAKEAAKRPDGSAVIRGIFSQVGSMPGSFGPHAGGGGRAGSHLAAVQVVMVWPEKRDISSEEFTNLWREKVGDIVGAESLAYSYTIGPQSDRPIDVQLSHRDLGVLERAASELADALRTFPGVKEIDDGFTPGKPQLDFTVKPEALSLGVTAADLGRQVRSAFYGAEVLRQQRGRDEVRVMVRLPESERKSEHDVNTLTIRTPLGGEIPLADAARVERDRAYTVINRAEGRRVMHVTADIPDKADAATVLRALKVDVLPGILAKYPRLTYSLEGEQREQRETLSNLAMGFALVLVLIFGLLAVPLRSYIQPIIVMAAIPFGIVGAVLGHILMGYNLSVLSLMGIVALAGVVVNDSLVLIHATNEHRNEKRTAFDAVTWAGGFRFRAIILTSVTTFAGLAPIIFETSAQARFLIPMAISLGFGIIFSTFITLLIVPSLYLIVEDFKRLPGAIKGMIVGIALGAAAAAALTVLCKGGEGMAVLWLAQLPMRMRPAALGVGLIVAGAFIGWGLGFLMRREEGIEDPESTLDN